MERIYKSPLEIAKETRSWHDLGVGKNVILGGLVLFFVSTTLHARTLTKQKLDLFNDALVNDLQNQCVNSKDGAWLKEKVTQYKGISPSVLKENLDTWVSHLEKLTVDGVEKKAFLNPGWLGTTGTVLGKDIKIGSVKGQVVFVDDPSSKDLEGKIWLVEVKDENTDPLMLSLQASSNKSLGLILYPNEKIPPLEGRVSTAVPVIALDSLEGQNLKEKVQKGLVNIEWKAKTDYPVKVEKTTDIFDLGPRKLKAKILVPKTDCRDLALMVGLWDWVFISGLELTGTRFELVEKIEDKDDIAVLDSSDFVLREFAESWIKLDHDPVDFKETKKELKDVLKESTSLDKILNHDTVTSYREDLKRLSSIIEDHPELAGDADILLKEFDLFEAVKELAALKEIHRYVEKGRIGKAQEAAKKLKVFEKVDVVSPAILSEYQKRAGRPDINVDPVLWADLIKGRENTDQLIEKLEAEIDRLTQSVNDNFSKLHKRIENLTQI